MVAGPSLTVMMWRADETACSGFTRALRDNRTGAEADVQVNDFLAPGEEIDLGEVRPPPAAGVLRESWAIVADRSPSRSA